MHTAMAISHPNIALAKLSLLPTVYPFNSIDHQPYHPHIYGGERLGHINPPERDLKTQTPSANWAFLLGINCAFRSNVDFGAPIIVKYLKFLRIKIKYS